MSHKKAVWVHATNDLWFHPFFGYMRPSSATDTTGQAWVRRGETWVPADAAATVESITDEQLAERGVTDMSWWRA